MSRSPESPELLTLELRPVAPRIAPPPTATRPTIAVLGNPNAGKSTLFNALTGLRQKVGNYPGVTVEKKVGACDLPSGRRVELLDLPGSYSLHPGSPDEMIVRDVLPNSPAAKAGMHSMQVDRLGNPRGFDVITRVQGQPVAQLIDLVDLLDDFQPGDKVKVEYMREDETHEAEVELGEVASS